MILLDFTEADVLILKSTVKFLNITYQGGDHTSNHTCNVLQKCALSPCKANMIVVSCVVFACTPLLELLLESW